MMYSMVMQADCLEWNFNLIGAIYDESRIVTILYNFI